MNEAPIRKPFVMENPQHVEFGSGEWVFWLACADPALYEFVEHMPQIAHLHYEDVWRRAHVILSPLYDYEDAWLWIHLQLEIETQRTKLSSIWGLDSEEVEGQS